MTGDITILYGSETGNAEEYAKYLKQRLRSYNLKPISLASLDDYPLRRLVTHTSYLIIICSTTGQGEIPRNGKKFMKFILKKKLPSDLFQHLHLTTFGLGDSSYIKYNYAIKKIHTRLMQLGCQLLSPRCEADEISPEGVDGYYIEWEAELIAALLNKFPNATQVSSEAVPMPEYRISVSKGDATKNSKEVNNNAIVSRLGKDGLKLGTVLTNNRITSADHFQDVRDFKFSSTDLNYSPGDTVSLFPCNFDEDVDALLQSQPQWLKIADKPLNVKNMPHAEGGFADVLTLRILFKYHLDIMSIPRRSFFALLWHFVDPSTEDGEREQEKLKEFGSFDEPEELYDYANRPRRSILETLLEFQNNLTIPVSYILDLFPLIRPRMFSIASCPSSNEVELVVAIVEYKTIIRKIRRGVCTRWLKNLKPGDQFLFSIQKSSFKYKNNNSPIIMVAPGTGIAPMKSLIDEVFQENSCQELYLFFGCRFKEKDNLVDSFWHGNENQNFHLINAYSRDSNSKYRYVQDALFAQSELIGKLLIEQNARVFVCGSSGKMPREVKITFVEIVKKFTGMEEDEAQKYIIDLEDNGRYKEDAW
ncbi:NADPH reductase, putative [Candida dubliniensis CD36]|uniref:NADPH-dependent diflavin oxidoreductase 1 n=1 Tax=Candida dubliniensis (strain CD36 / ATCC MYA-646 / CBS 7987 / NCPF 3949 / NRRL Y-17841) TaxID=573826 RepID=B9WAD8_CANDC|nr:NADPH reductase, putative [Candida dubliniensis CD36]CAX43357.1 NADPH reductase, putative [Candida dubliniensis CD36]